MLTDKSNDKDMHVNVNINTSGSGSGMGIIDTFPERERTSNRTPNRIEMEEAKMPTLKSTSTTTGRNPSGMVIHAQYAQEAIMDPTWLDSDDDDDANHNMDADAHADIDVDADVDPEAEHEHGIHTNDLLSVTGSTSASASASASASISLGSLSVGSCGLGLNSSLSAGLGSASVGASAGISLSGSEGSGYRNMNMGMNMGMNMNMGHTYRHAHRKNKRIQLNQVDIVDMGVESVTSSNEGSHDHVLDYLYDLDRRDYDLSDGEMDELGTETDGDAGTATGTDTDGENDRRRGTDTGTGIGDIDTDDDHFSNSIGIDTGDNDEDSAYLPQYLKSPPRLSRVDNDDLLSTEHSSDFSIASQEQEGRERHDAHDTSECECPSKVKPKSSRRMDVGLEEKGSPTHSHSSSESTDVVTECTTMDEADTNAEEQVQAQAQAQAQVGVDAPQAKLNLHHRIEYDALSTCTSSSIDTSVPSNRAPSAPTNLNQHPAGIVMGDSVLSIMDCPGSRTRKKRAASNVKKDGMDDLQWGAHAASSTLSYMRSLRKVELGGMEGSDEKGSVGSGMELSREEIQASSLVSGKTGKKIITLEKFPRKTDDDNSKSVHSPDLTSRSMESRQKSPHKSFTLDALAIDFMKVSVIAR